MGGRPMPPSTRNVTPGVTGFEAKYALLHAAGVLAGRHPHVHHGAALRRDDVRAQAAVYGAYVHRRPACGIVEGEERLDQVRELQDGAGPVLRVEARVRGLPLDETAKRPTPLRAVLSFPDGPSEGSMTNALSATRARRRMWRVDSWLPTSSSELTKTMGVTVGFRPRSLQRPEREDHLRKPALHVVDAGTLDHVVLRPRPASPSSVPSGQTVSQCPSRSCTGAWRSRRPGRA